MYELSRFVRCARPCHFPPILRDAEVAGSNPVAPTRKRSPFTGDLFRVLLQDLNLYPHCVSNTCVRAQRGLQPGGLRSAPTEPAAETAGAGGTWLRAESTLINI